MCLHMTSVQCKHKRAVLHFLKFLLTGTQRAQNLWNIVYFQNSTAFIILVFLFVPHTFTHIVEWCLKSAPPLQELIVSPMVPKTADVNLLSDITCCRVYLFLITVRPFLLLLPTISGSEVKADSFSGDKGRRHGGKVQLIYFTVSAYIRRSPAVESCLLKGLVCCM